MGWVGKETPHGRHVIWSQPRPDGSWVAGATPVIEPRSGPITGATEDEAVAKVRDAIARSSPDHIGMDALLSRFAASAPAGFDDPAFHAERSASLAARQALSSMLPLEAAAVAEPRHARILSVTSEIWEWPTARRRDVPALRRALAGPSGANLLRAWATIATGDDPSDAFALVEGAMRTAGEDCATWLRATLLPFLWAPTEAVLVEQAAMLDFSRAAGDPYWNLHEPGVTARGYVAAVELVRRTNGAIESLRPRDNGDVLILMRAAATPSI